MHTICAHGVVLGVLCFVKTSLILERFLILRGFRVWCASHNGSLARNVWIQVKVTSCEGFTEHTFHNGV
eukprot:4844933-Amphidinium_carterae.1